MNFSLKLDDTNWQNFLGRAYNVLRSKDSLLKRAFLTIWPQEAASHFDEEMGVDGPWAPWKTSTRAQRIVHEIRTALGRQHAEGRLTKAEMAKGARKTANLRGREYAAGNVIRQGGKLLQVTGRLRTETVQEPILTYSMGQLVVESPTPYSGYLDEGTENMVARPFMWLGEEAQDNLSQVFLEMLGEGVGGLD